MASVHLPIRANSPSDDYPSLVYTTEVQVHKEQQDEEDDIPYHAREYAQPFTYGNLPEGFTRSELNHVEIDDETPKTSIKSQQSIPPPSPSALRKTKRPSISPSRPVLHKTPTRQEFEEMLMERREQALREQQSNAAIKLAQNAAIQKDLDELQGKLNKKALQERDAVLKSLETKAIESVDLPNAAIRQPAKSKVITFEVPENSITNKCVPIEIETTQNSNNINNNNSHIISINDTKRPETPAFPAIPKTLTRDGRSISPYPLAGSGSGTGSGSGALTPLSFGNEPHLVEPHLVKFARDSSEFWYKPHLSREETVGLLRNAEPGMFIIRNSTTYKNAYGLVLRVAKPPPGVVVSENSNGDELVRHFLLEPTARGVRLKGCANEPVFTSLSALVYEHSINQLALPCTLLIPDRDLLHLSGDQELIVAQKQMLMQGAACNVLYLFSYNTESLTGHEAVRKTVHEMYSKRPLPQPVEVHFKVSQQGVTLTDNTRSRFFRRHYATQCISHFDLDPDHRFWTVMAKDEGLERAVNKTIFAFVARQMTGAKDNECHVFCDLAANQPASAIISFASKVLPIDKQNHKML